MNQHNDPVRKFETGATRTSDTGKPDYEGYLSPLVIREFGKYMTKHRYLPDGTTRDSDNWQKGIPLNSYIKSLFRHFHDLWMIHRGNVALDHTGKVVSLYDTLSAMLFNVQGYFHETIKANAQIKTPIEEFRDRAVKHAGEPIFVSQHDPNEWESTYTITVDPGEPEIEDQFSVENMRLADHNFLIKIGCTRDVAELIAKGTSYGSSIEEPKYVYIAGPMRGYEKYNFPAFDAARDRFLQNAWNVISPADIDRAHDAGTEDISAEEVVRRTKQYVYRDFYALFHIAHYEPGSGAIAMLPGWEKSTGAVAEFFLARWLGLTVLDARDGFKLREFDEKALYRSVVNFLISQMDSGTTILVNNPEQF